MSYPARSVYAGTQRSQIREDTYLWSILICFAFFAWVSWGKLAHLVWDTGQETEIAARLLAGETLYQDLHTYYGPLAYYVNAIALQLFGHHLEVFYTVGLSLAFAATSLVYHLAKHLTNATWATLCTLCVLVYCAFSPGGLWNFVVPYSYGGMYATVFCLLAFVALNRYANYSKMRWLVAAAILCGLAGLAKQEYGVAAIAAVVVGANLCHAKSWNDRLIRSILLVTVASICVAVPLMLLAQQSSWETLLASMVPLNKSSILRDSGVLDVSPATTLNNWKSSFKNFAASSLVVVSAIVGARWIARYTRISRFSNRLAIEFIVSIMLAWVGFVLLQMHFWSNTFKIIVAIALVVVSIAIANRWLASSGSSNSQPTKLLFKILIASAFGGFLLYSFRSLACCSDTVFHPLDRMTWLLPVLAAWFALRWRNLVEHKYAPLLWSLLIFSIVINARFLFYINFYGLYAVTAIILFFTLLYNIAVQTGAPIGRFLLICLLIGGAMNVVEFGQYRYAVNSPHGTIHIEDTKLADAFNQTIRYIQDSQASSVLVLPAGATINFLSATHSPSQETIFLPGIVPTIEAQRDFITRMEQEPPELIVYVDIPFFWLKEGYQTYAEFNSIIHDWVVQHRLVHTSSKLDYYDREWYIRIYTNSDQREISTIS